MAFNFASEDVVAIEYMPREGTDDHTDLGERVSRLEGSYDHLATSGDIAMMESSFAEMRADTREDIVRVEGRITGLRAEVKEDISRVESRVANPRADLKESFNRLENSFLEFEEAMREEFCKFRAEIRSGMVK